MVTLFEEDFTGTAQTLSDGQTSLNGKWTCVYNGYGFVKNGALTEPKGGRAGSCLHFKPQANQSGTSAALVQFNQDLTDFDNTFYLRTTEQLHTTPANWEVAWFMWAYTDNTHHYYAMIKANGNIEVGGKDYVKVGTTQIRTPDNVTTTVGAGNQDQQFFLSTSASVTFALHQWYKIRLLIVGTSIKIYVDDVLKVDIADNGSTGSWLGSPKTFQRSSQMAGGKFMAYAEDAYGQMDQVKILSV